jgi:hypothetical protein
MALASFGTLDLMAMLRLYFAIEDHGGNRQLCSTGVHVEDGRANLLLN